MTGTDVDVETQAQRIADRGRDTLVERMRAAYRDAAAAHADVISLDDERIEQMVQSAVDRADGLQWRRALARVASDELGLSVPEALAHPAVARAQELLGAPSYEQSLNEMISQPARLPAPEPKPEPAAASPHDELETVEADEVMLELLPEPDPVEYETEPYDVAASFIEQEPPPADAVPEAAQATELFFPAIHLGGVANLPTKREGLGVRVSQDGLDIMQGRHEIIGRLVWDEIETFEVPDLRIRRRHKQVRARLIVRTPHGDANFEVPNVSGEELRGQVKPLLQLYGRH